MRKGSEKRLQKKRYYLHILCKLCIDELGSAYVPLSRAAKTVVEHTDRDKARRTQNLKIFLCYYI